MTAKELKKIIALCKAEGIAKIKSNDLDLEFAPGFVKPKVKVDKNKKEVEDTKYSTQDVLFWSVSDQFMNEAND